MEKEKDVYAAMLAMGAIFLAVKIINRRDDEPDIGYVATDYLRMGRIDMTVAKEAHIPAGNIYMSYNYVRHSENRNDPELKQRNITVLRYVRFVCMNFNQIRKGSDGSLLLVVKGRSESDTVAVQLNPLIDDKRRMSWEVRTAQP